METFDIHSCNLLYCRYRLCIKAVDVLRPSKPDDPGVYITLFDKKKIQKPRGVRGFFAFLFFHNDLQNIFQAFSLFENISHKYVTHECKILNNTFTMILSVNMLQLFL